MKSKREDRMEKERKLKRRERKYITGKERK